LFLPPIGLQQLVFYPALNVFLLPCQVHQVSLVDVAFPLNKRENKVFKSEVVQNVVLLVLLENLFLSDSRVV
jgi:hypothetical protein